MYIEIRYRKKGTTLTARISAYPEGLDTSQNGVDLTACAVVDFGDTTRISALQRAEAFAEEKNVAVRVGEALVVSPSWVKGPGRRALPYEPEWARSRRLELVELDKLHQRILARVEGFEGLEVENQPWANQVLIRTAPRWDPYYNATVHLHHGGLRHLERLLGDYRLRPPRPPKGVSDA